MSLAKFLAFKVSKLGYAVREGDLCVGWELTIGREVEGIYQDGIVTYGAAGRHDIIRIAQHFLY